MIKISKKTVRVLRAITLQCMDSSSLAKRLDIPQIKVMAAMAKLKEKGLVISRPVTRENGIGALYIPTGLPYAISTYTYHPKRVVIVPDTACDVFMRLPAPTGHVPQPARMISWVVA